MGRAALESCLVPHKGPKPLNTGDPGDPRSHTSLLLDCEKSYAREYASTRMRQAKLRKSPSPENLTPPHELFQTLGSRLR